MRGYALAIPMLLCGLMGHAFAQDNSSPDGCLEKKFIRDYQVTDSSHVRVAVDPSGNYLITMRKACSDMRFADPLSFEKRTPGACFGDGDRVGFTGPQTGLKQACTIGKVEKL